MEPLFLSMMFNNSVASYFICKLVDRLYYFIIEKTRQLLILLFLIVLNYMS